MSPAVPTWAIAGTKRIKSPVSSSTAAESKTAPKAVQMPPPLVENCQLPLLLSTATMATPSGSPVSTSMIRSPPALEMMLATVLPAGLETDSAMSVRVMLPVLSRMGASFTAVTTIDAVSVAREYAAVPPLVLASTWVPATPEV